MSFIKLKNAKNHFWNMSPRYAIKQAIKHNLTQDSIRRYWRFQGETDYICLYQKRKENKIFGKEFATFVSEGNFNRALNYVNRHYAPPNISIYDLFNDAFRQDTFYCDDCNLYFSNDYSHNVNDDRSVCDSCVSNYYWNEHFQFYTDEQPENDDDDYSIIGEYHSSRHIVGHIPSNSDKLKLPLLGMELEVEVNGSLDREDYAQRILDNLSKYKNYRYCAIENDGSLSNGFEIVTGYSGLETHREQLLDIQNVAKGLKSHNTSTCGLHIHICKKDMSILHASKLILFINNPCNKALIFALARRENPRFAKNKTIDEVKRFSFSKHPLDMFNDRKSKNRALQLLNLDRYESLNFQNEKTIEFRFFRGSLIYKTIIACLEFTYMSWFFAKHTSVNDLTTDQFLKFISRSENLKDTKFLREYLILKGFQLPTIKKIDLALTEEI